MATHTHPSNPCTICGHPLEGKEAIEFVENHAKKYPSNATDHPLDLIELGKKYPALKKEYNDLQNRLNQVLAERIITQNQRDRLLKALEKADDLILLIEDGTKVSEDIWKDVIEANGIAIEYAKKPTK